MKQKLWQLKKISTNENLNEPQLLPENWGPIFGLSGFKDKLNNLSWVGMPDKGWFEVGEVDLTQKQKEDDIKSQIEKFLQDSNQFVAADNLDMTKAKREEWMEYRRVLKEITNQPNFPNEIYWPKIPD